MLEVLVREDCEHSGQVNCVSRFCPFQRSADLLGRTDGDDIGRGYQDGGAKGGHDVLPLLLEGGGSEKVDVECDDILVGAFSNGFITSGKCIVRG